MIHLEHPLRLDELPAVIVYPDDAVSTRFYALPRSPRLMLDESGTPIIKLLVYGSGRGAAFKPAGGMLSLTTAMQLTRQEEDSVVQRLSRYDRTAELAGVTWLDGSATVTVAGTRLIGRPSLYGANTCAFSESLDATRTEGLLEAWSQGLPDVAISYVLSVGAAQVKFEGPVNAEGRDLSPFVSRIEM